MNKRPVVSVQRGLAATICLLVAACRNPYPMNSTHQDSDRNTIAVETWTLPPIKTHSPSPTSTDTATDTQTPSLIETSTLENNSEVVSETPSAQGSGISTETSIPPLEKSRYFETRDSIEYSYIPPEGWRKVPIKVPSPASWWGPTQPGGVICTLGFFAKTSEISAADAAKELLDLMAKLKGVRILFQGNFDNDAKLDAYKSVILMPADNSVGQMVNYFFQKRGYAIMATYVRSAAWNMEQDAIVDLSLKTMRYE